MDLSSNCISDQANTNIQIPQEARFCPIEKFSGLIGPNYYPIAVYKHPETGKWIASSRNSQENITESFKEGFNNQETAIEYVVDEKLPLGSFYYRYAIIYDESNKIEDIIFGRGWEDYRVMQSRADSGWVHGHRGDHDHNPGHDDKQAITEGAKEAVISNGYNKLLIEDEEQEVEAVWVNCFLTTPKLPIQIETQGQFMSEKPDLGDSWGINYEDNSQVTYTHENWDEGGLCLAREGDQYRIWLSISDPIFGAFKPERGPFDSMGEFHREARKLAQEVEQHYIS